ncbi:hypothetical protein L208DRAFT_1338656, partial [Tricholoma matsutake]
AESYVETLENGLNIEERWTATSAEYQTFCQANVQTNYERALDELERLVVMRLFELAKLSCSGTGYKLRRQLGKALQRRSEAIGNALSRYNTQAAKLTPPRPSLLWKEIVDYSFIGEFDTLRHSGADICNQPWTHTARREATVKFFKLCRACEEIMRLDIEMRWLRVSIRNEAIRYEQAISQLSSSDPPLAAELHQVWKLQSTVN